MIELITEPSKRKIGTNRRSLTGWVSTKNNGMVAFESSLERDFVILVDYDKQLKSIKSQPLTVKYKDSDGETKRYTPDYLIEYDRYTPILCEIKYRQDLLEQKAEILSDLRVAINLCKERGWIYRIITEGKIRKGYILRNIDFVRGYMDMVPNEETVDHLISKLSTIGKTRLQNLIEMSFDTKESRINSISTLWHLIASGRIYIDFNQPLSMASIVSLESGDIKCPKHPLFPCLRV